MTDLDELRQTLADRARSIPDGAGLIELARVKAAQRRRRRTVASAVVAGVLVVAVALAIPLAVARLRAGPAVVGTSPSAPASPTPAASPTPTAGPTPTGAPYRQPGELTVSLATNPRWYSMIDQVTATTQFLIIRQLPNASGGAANVAVHDPGTFEPGDLPQGEAITVSGHPAFFSADAQIAPAGTARSASGSPTPRPAVRGMAIAWPDSSGAWVVVYDELHTSTRAVLTEIAGAVRTSPRHALASPVRFGWLPAGQKLWFGSSRSGDVEIELNFGETDVPGAAEVQHLLAGADPGYPISVQITGRDDYVDGHVAAMGPPTMINGIKTWNGGGGFVIPTGGDVIIAQTDTCYMSIVSANASRIPLADLQHMVAGAQFSSCKNRGSWGSVLQ